jgi:hypothetical protein
VERREDAKTIEENPTLSGGFHLDTRKTAMSIDEMLNQRLETILSDKASFQSS